MTPTQAVLNRLLKQNVGRGSAWPGARCLWEVNADVDFLAQPHATLDVDGDDVRVRLSTFHYLDHFLEYDARLDAIYQAWQTKREWRRGQADMRDFVAWLRERWPKLYLSDSYYGGTPPRVRYTYNTENSLSQDFQYLIAHASHVDTKARLGAYVLLQTHNGCDATGGLSDIAVFRLRELDSGDNEHHDFFETGHVHVCCETGKHSWYSHENGWSWDDLGDDTAQPLEDYHVEHEATNDLTWDLVEGVFVDKDGVAYCPECTDKPVALTAHPGYEY